MDALKSFLKDKNITEDENKNYQMNCKKLQINLLLKLIKNC